MQTNLSMAFRAAILLSGLAAGCSDTPVGPRERSHAPVQGALGSLLHTESFSGARADSVLRLLDAGWHDHGDARQNRLSWRRAHGVPDSVGDPGLPKPIVLQPIADLVIGDGGSLRPPPQVISHYEALHFGHVDPYTNAPDAVEAELTFIGDQAEIVLGNLTITGKNGSQYPANGRIAMGPGQIINCADILFGSCDLKRHLNGLLTVYGAPLCDANGNGSVSYYVTNLNQTMGVFGPIGGDGSVSANAPIGTSAPPCPSADDTNSDPRKPSPGDSTTSTPNVPSVPGSPSGPPPVYDGPGIPPLPPSYPAPRPAGGTEDFWCQTTNTYQYVGGVRTLFTTVIDCYHS
jgi:hypothetical protein